MIVAVSIVDLHKEDTPESHVGAYMFEIDKLNDSHFEFLTLPCSPENEAEMRPYLNRLLSAQDMPMPKRLGDYLDEGGDAEAIERHITRSTD